MLKHQIRLWFIAQQFYTRVPVPSWVGYHPDWLNAATRYFPLVGAIVGLSVGAIYAVFNHWLPSELSAALAIGWGIWLTGAFHEDGFADTCDALGGGQSRSDILRIMQDSRIGAYGAIGIGLLLFIKIHAVAALNGDAAIMALVVAHTVSRAAAITLMRTLPYARAADTPSKSKPVAQGVRACDAWCAYLSAAALVLGAALWLTAPWLLSAACLAAGLAAVGLRHLTQQRLQGYTGDVLGATQQLAETAFLIAWVGMSEIAS